MISKFSEGDFVDNLKEHKFPGVIVSKFKTTSGELRYVVECTARVALGCLHIFNEDQLEFRMGD